MIINGLLLAAGNSSRLGQPKQLLPFKNTTLLRHVESIISPQVNNLFTVIGYRADDMSNELVSSTQIVNPDWEKGMGNSLRSGLYAAIKDADAILITLCDQLLIPSEHFIALIQLAKEYPDKIIASDYQNTQGVPAIFPKTYFNQLLNTGDKQGAQILIHSNQDQVISINCEQAGFDVDTPKDLDLLC